MIKPGRLFYPYLAIALFTFGLALINGNSFILRAGMLWLGLLLIALIWMATNLHGLLITRSVREKKIEFGQMIYESHYITNDSWIPKILLEIIDQSKLTRRNTSRIISFLAPYATYTFSTLIEADQRGLYYLGPTRVRSVDIFGLFSREKLYPAQGTILIRPPILDIQTESVYESYRFGGKAQNIRRPDETILPTSIRDHLPGDSLKRIHWPSTAKHQKLMVREFDSEPQADGYIVLNCNKSVYFSEENRKSDQEYFITKKEKSIRVDSMEYQVCIAGSIAKSLLRSSTEMGLFLSNAKSEMLPPDQGDRQLNKMLDILSLATSDGEFPLREYILQIMPSIPRKSKLYILTSTLEKGLVSLGKELVASGYYPEMIVLFSEDQPYEYWLNEQTIVNEYGGKLRVLKMDGKLYSLQNDLNHIFA